MGGRNLPGALLSDSGYTTVLSGKWHVGEAEGMRPHDVGFDEFYGFYPAQKELSQAFDKRRYPDLVLNPDMTTVASVGIAPWLFNLYIDPKEEHPVGHRMNAFIAPMAAELKAHAATFRKYPPKDIGL